MSQPAQESAIAVTKAYEFALWLLPKTENFPKTYRMSLGDRLVTAVLDQLQMLVRASYAGDKMPLLRSASEHANELRYLLRLAKDLKVLPLKSYDFAAEKSDEIGRMVGGWMKSQVRKP